MGPPDATTRMILNPVYFIKFIHCVILAKLDLKVYSLPEYFLICKMAVNMTHQETE